jgi:hypothetical protein
MTEIIEFCQKVNDEYLYSLNSNGKNVRIHFRNSEIVFDSYLIFKNGYPNEEVYGINKYFYDNNLKLSTLYRIIGSLWIEEIKVNNRIHPKHKDEIFDNFKHYIIFFSDESFECIAKSYEVKDDR